MLLYSNKTAEVLPPPAQVFSQVGGNSKGRATFLQTKAGDFICIGTSECLSSGGAGGIVGIVPDALTVANGGDQVIEVSVGYAGGSCLTAARDLYAWGTYMQFANTGSGNLPRRKVASNVAWWSAPWVTILWLDATDGCLYGSGMEQYGLLFGNSTSAGVRKVYTPPAGRTIRKVSQGWYHTLVLLDNGDVYATGDSQYVGVTGITAKPSLVQSGVTDILAGNYCSFYRKADGVYGGGRFDTLGLGLSGSASLTKLAHGMWPVAVSDSTFFAGADGLYACGYNAAGQLGLLHANPVGTPTKVPQDVRTVSVGSYHTIFTLNDGSHLGFGALSSLTGQNTGDAVQPLNLDTAWKSYPLGKIWT